MNRARRESEDYQSYRRQLAEDERARRLLLRGTRNGKPVLPERASKPVGFDLTTIPVWQRLLRVIGIPYRSAE